MSNWNELENQLRSWTPRAPSEKVKARLFGGAAGHAVATTDTRHPTWHWLAPAMAVFLFGMFVVGRQPGGLGTGGGVLAQFVMSEPAEQARASHCANNSVQVMTFDSTNGSHSLTTAPPVSWTNRLIQ
jgi:hypothetical protein